MINASLTSGTYPTTLKQARVTLLLKKPSHPPTQVENYRPGSLLPFLSKTIERAVFKQVTDYLSHNNLLDPNHSGFKSGHSPETALLAQALKEVRAISKSAVLTLLDLSAAVDTVKHGILLSILSSMGITGRAHSWFESYLTGRSFNVYWLGKTSATHNKHKKDKAVPNPTHLTAPWLSKHCRLAVPTPRSRQSKLFSCVVPRWWNDLPSTTRTGASLSIFKKLFKTQLFREHLLRHSALYFYTVTPDRA